ncbi:hypothetical protein BMETH_127_2 [methanotrophic bacterial endosymbiont of Bathymodiolus sp.]|nr:hypothetical protein BMETH_127_2 [methanotrophic bacterial endosymbiont of Bathymodiolus sp.]
MLPAKAYLLTEENKLITQSQSSLPIYSHCRAIHPTNSEDILLLYSLSHSSTRLSLSPAVTPYYKNCLLL